MAFPQEPRVEETKSASSMKSEDRKSNGMIRWFAHSPLGKNERHPERKHPERSRSFGARRRQTTSSKVTLDRQSEEKTRIAELEMQLAESQERVQQLEAAAAQKPNDKLLAIADKSNEGIFEASHQSQSHNDSIPGVAATPRPIVNDAIKAVPVTPDVSVSKKYSSPSVNKEDHDQEDDVLKRSGYTEETELSLPKSDDEESLDQELDPETNISSWHGIALESAVCAGLIPPDTKYQLQTPHIIPPSEVVAICEPESESSDIDGLDFKIQLEDAQLRARAYRCKLEAAEDLIASLFRDMEKARLSIHALVSRNVNLAGAIKGMRLDQEEHYISRNTLMKLCMYISPVFILCGGLEYFVSTILLVWVMLELEAAVAPAEDNEDKHQRTKKSHHHSKRKSHHHANKKSEEKMMEPPRIPPILPVHVDTNAS